MVQRLPNLKCPPKRNKYFKGNFLFASTTMLRQMKPTPVDDYLSLMYVAWYFVKHGLPWTDYIDEQMEVNPNENLYDVPQFKFVRIQRDVIFKKEFIETDLPFGKVFTYLYQIQER